MEDQPAVALWTSWSARSSRTEEGSLFSYLVRVMTTARKLFEACELPELRDLYDRVRAVLARVDPRLGDGG
jgi:hypothetical protein